MSISKSFNKRIGATYVYEVYENYWDKEKKKYVQKRRMIGKIDPETGEIVPTRSRKKAPTAPSSEQSDQQADYKSLYLETRKLLDQKELELSLLQSELSSLKTQIVSVLKSALPVFEKQAAFLHSVEEDKS